MEAIESLAGMVSSMLDFPLVEFLGSLVPAGGSEAGQQVSLLVWCFSVDDDSCAPPWPGTCSISGSEGLATQTES